MQDPVCDMDLKPKMISAEEMENPELGAMSRRFWVSLALTVPVLLPGHGRSHPRAAAAAPAAGGRRPLDRAAPGDAGSLWGGSIFFRRVWASLVLRNLNMFTLIGLGTGVAYLYSVVAILFPGIFPAAFRDPKGNIEVYFEAAGDLEVG